MPSLQESVEDALRVPAFRHVQSILVVQHGALQAERYFRGRRPTDLSNVHSVTRSVLATLVGIAVAQGSLALETRVCEVLELEPGRLEEDKRALTVGHLLTMTSGLQADAGYDIDEIADRGESWVEGPLEAPLLSSPGRAFTYNNGAAHVLGVVLARAVGMPLAPYAEQHLFGPLGIEEYGWPSDPEGNHLGYAHLELRPRDLLRFGQLYLGEGTWDGAEIVPGSFITAATTAHTEGGPPERVPYGYLWWITDAGGYPSFFAGGYAGQYLTVVPCLDSSRHHDGGRGRLHRDLAEPSPPRERGRRAATYGVAFGPATVAGFTGSFPPACHSMETTSTGSSNPLRSCSRGVDVRNAVA